MFKKFLITFVLCLGIFSTVVFAESRSVNDFQNVFNTVPKEYIDIVKKDFTGPYIFVLNDVDKSYMFFFAPNGATSFTSKNDSYGTILHNSSTDGYLRLLYNSSTGGWSRHYGDSGQDMGINIKHSDLKLGEKYSSVPIADSTFDYLVNDLIFPKVPIMEEVTVQEAIGSLMTGFGAKLKVLLPVGVTILAILLGVSLIPRLKAWFL